jgi:DNA-binding response OmpR family regulator
MNKVLVVDDEPAVTDMLDNMLSASGFVSLTVNTGPAAIEAARKWKPDVILLDLMMPDVDGWQVCRAIRTFSQVPILILSSVVDSEGVMRALEEGADNYLIKPVPMGVLVSSVRLLARDTHGGPEHPNAKKRVD